MSVARLARPLAGGRRRTDRGLGAPGRVNLIGEHTDYNDGYVLPFALPHGPWSRRRPLSEWTVVVGRLGSPVDLRRRPTSRPGGVTGWAAYVAGVVWALRGARPGRRRAPGSRVASDVPVGAGLSSSAALECACWPRWSTSAGIDLPDWDRPALAQRAENDYVGVPCGIMDQSASTLCRDGHALFLDCRSLDAEHIPFDLAGARARDAGRSTPTRRTGYAGGEYADPPRHLRGGRRGRSACRPLRDVPLPTWLPRWPRLDDVAGRRVRHVVTENQRVLDTVDAAARRAGRATSGR